MTDERRHDPRRDAPGSRHDHAAPYVAAQRLRAARCAAPRKRHPYWMRDGRYPAASVLHALSPLDICTTSQP